MEELLNEMAEMTPEFFNLIYRDLAEAAEYCGDQKMNETTINTISFLSKCEHLLKRCKSALEMRADVVEEFKN